MLLVGSGHSLPLRAVVIFAYSVPDLSASAPKPEGGRVHRAVITGYRIRLKAFGKNFRNVLFLREHGVHKSLRSHPFPENEPLVENARVKPPVPFPHRVRQRRVVVHGKVEVQRVFLPRLEYPFPVEPVVRIRGIAAEPQLGVLGGAPCDSLLHKGARHESDLVQQRAAKGYALNERGGALVPSSEKVEAVRPASRAYVGIAAAYLFLAGKAQPPQSGQKRDDKVPPDRRDGLAAQGEIPAVKISRRPGGKGEGGAKGLAAPYRAVADYCVAFFIPLRFPPGENGFLLCRKTLEFSQTNTSFQRVRVTRPAGTRRPARQPPRRR